MKRAHYGFDGPGTIFKLFLAGLFIGSIAILFYKDFYIVKFLMFLLIALAGLLCLASALLMIMSSLVGKYWQRDSLLSLILWQGNEKVLDVGCGRGLLLIGAAKNLTTGKAVGIDIWQKKDLSGNTKRDVWENAKIEDVSDKIEVLDADARKMPFSDKTFDIVLSSMVIHNIVSYPEREKALKEIVRVLKPNGILLIQDYKFTQEYEQILKNLNLKDVDRSNLQWLLFPPVRIVSAIK